MNRLKELETRYATGDYIAVQYDGISFNITYPPFSVIELIEIIHKKHKHILDSYLENGHIEIEQWTNKHQGWINDNGFIKNYQEWHKYVIVDEYIEYRKALAEGKTVETDIGSTGTWVNVEESPYYDKSYGFVSTKNHYRIKPESYHIDGSSKYLSDESISEQCRKLEGYVENYCTCDSSGVDNTTGLCIFCGKEYRDGTTQLSKPLNNFEEYGFTADFEGEILKEFKDYSGTHLLGVRKDLVGNDVVEVWCLDGEEIKGYCYDNEAYNLTPIKSEWYQDESNFPVLCIDGHGDFEAVYSKKAYLDRNWRLATDEEIDSLKIKG